jgi:hypothetical protein
MVAISQTDTTALLLLQRNQAVDFRNPLALLTSEHFAVIGAESLDATLLDTFSESFDLRKEYAETYDRIRKEHPGITDANAAHNALVEVIMGNRDRFPPEGFAVHTRFPEGGSVTTFIAGVTALGETAGVEPWSVQDFRDRVAALYRAA